MALDMFQIISSKIYRWFRKGKNLTDVTPPIAINGNATQKSFVIKSAKGKDFLSFTLTERQGRIFCKISGIDWESLPDNQRRRQAKKEWKPEWLRKLEPDSGVGHGEQENS